MVKKVKLSKKNKKDKVKGKVKSKAKGKKVEKVDQEEPEFGVRYIADKVGCSHLKVQKYLRNQRKPRIGRFYDLETKKAADRVVKELS